MLLVLEPSALAVLSGKGGQRFTVVNVIMPNNVGSTATLSFVPANILVRVAVNNTIVWTDNDVASGQSHTVTTTSAPTASSNFDSLSTFGAIDPGDTYTVTPTALGTYHYHCRFHSWMSGTIVVVA